MKTLICKNKETYQIEYALSTGEQYTFGDLLRIYQEKRSEQDKEYLFYDFEQDKFIPVEKLEEYIAVLEAVKITKEMMRYNW